jgi:hypothetical protein
VRQKKAIDSAVEDSDLYLTVSFQRRDDLVQLRDGLGPKNIQRRVVKVTRRYNAVRRSRRICSPFFVAMFASKSGPGHRSLRMAPISGCECPIRFGQDAAS